MKLPAFQFYPGDWRKDPGVQALDFFARGVWFEMLCLMHESDERGVLLLAGKPMPEEALASLLGINADLLKQNLSKIEAYGVASRREEDGALYSRRIVRDENLRKIRSDAGKQGGNPILLKQNPTTGDKQNPTPSSSSSSSSSDSFSSSSDEEEGRGSVRAAKKQPAREISGADPRFQPITSKFGALYEEVTGREYGFDGGKDGAALKKFLSKRKRITANQFLDAARQILALGISVGYATACAKAQTLAAICSLWPQATADVDKYGKDGKHRHIAGTPHVNGNTRVAMEVVDSGDAEATPAERRLLANIARSKNGLPPVPPEDE